jgi:hypothetical protein
MSSNTKRQYDLEPCDDPTPQVQRVPPVFDVRAAEAAVHPHAEAARRGTAAEGPPRGAIGSARGMQRQQSGKYPVGRGTDREGGARSLAMGGGVIQTAA